MLTYELVYRAALCSHSVLIQLCNQEQSLLMHHRYQLFQTTTIMNTFIRQHGRKTDRENIYNRQ